MKTEPIVSTLIQLVAGGQINWEIAEAHKHGATTHQVVCGHCGEARMVLRSTIHMYIRLGRIYTGVCRKCAPKPPKNKAVEYGPNNPNFKTGRTLSQSGYWVITLSSLSEADRTIAEPMSQSAGSKTGTRRVAEHRLVMAQHLGRPLLKSEIVHHRSGVRTDNRIENLELLTRDTHFPGHDHDYQLLQEVLTEIVRLRKLVIELGGNPD